ncbi:MAG: formylglycine-generating enzyme family protein [Alphaproteobacteria bacterium]
MYRPCLLLIVACTLANTSTFHADMQSIGTFAIDRTEVTVGAFRKFADAPGLVTKAERDGGGMIYEAGWVRKAGWTWRRPFGQAAHDDEPAVHVTFVEAQTYCRWAGKRLPTDAEWVEAAYTERRPSPPPYRTGRTYDYPIGDTPTGANCLADCGPTPNADYAGLLARGVGHVRAGLTRPGVNGLLDMGANVWEWVDGSVGAERITRGGSWWYGAGQMHRAHGQTKPPDTAVVFIGFRCARTLP